ncbi:MAG: DNA starvation/stationary phase protection protein [Pseudomonadota bacterium]
MAAALKKLEPSALKALSRGLTKALAETTVTTQKAQNFHWNVTGMAFGPLHALFQEIYEDHFEGQDDLAERLRALGAHVDGRYAAYLKLSAVDESDGKLAAEKMIEALAEDQETLSATMQALAAVAEKNDDVVTNDLAINRAEKHDKFAWMLRAHLG